MVSSTLVTVADDAELRLVTYLGETAPSHMLSPNFLQECQGYIVQGDAVGLMRTIVNDAGAIASLLTTPNTDEAISGFSLLAALLDRVGETDPNEEAMLSQSLQNAVVTLDCSGSSTPENALAKRRILLLSALYNLRRDGTEKCKLVTSMITLAAAHQPAMLAEGKGLGKLLTEDDSSNSSVGDGVPQIVAFLDGWNVPSSDRRGLFRAAASGIPDSVARKQRFTLLLVESYTEASQVDEDAITAAKEAAIGAIRDPITLFVHQRNMLAMPAIQALANNAATKTLHALLDIFQEGKLEEYNAFLKNNGGDKAVKDLGLDPVTCVRHMRILSLCSLAAEHEEIPYGTVAKTLQLDSEKEVESWVIAAVSSGLLSAKMDQLQQSVMVERSVVRKFDVEQWKALQSRLNVWKQNVRGILESYKQSAAMTQPPGV